MKESFLFLLLSYALTLALSQRERNKNLHSDNVLAHCYAFRYSQIHQLS